MPARISRGLSRNGRRPGGGAGTGPLERRGVIDVTVAGMVTYGMNVNFACPNTPLRSHGQKNQVLRGRVCARTRT